jgi:hypothetical protein
MPASSVQGVFEFGLVVSCPASRVWKSWLQLTQGLGLFCRPSLVLTTE